MKTLMLSVGLLAALSSILQAQEQPQRWCLVLAIEEYRDMEKIPRRMGAATAGVAVYEGWISEYQGNIPLAQARGLIDSAAYFDGVRRVFEELAASIKPNDTLLVYVALQTAIAKSDQAPQLYLLVYDSDLANLAKTAVSLGQFKLWLAQIPAKTKLLFLDCGFRDALRPEGTPADLQPPPTYLQDLSEVCPVWSPVNPAQKLVETPLKRPALGFCLYTAMQAFGDRTDDGKITLGELLQYTRETLQEAYRRQPRDMPQLTLAGNLDPNLHFANVPPRDRSCPREMRRVGNICIDIYEAPNKPGAQPLTPEKDSFWYAEAVCKQAGKRMCTAEEWRMGCTGPQRQNYPYGNKYQAGYCNIRSGDDKAELIGTRPFCVSPYGLYDMVGNVAEWTGSWPPEGQEGLKTANFLGGSYADTLPGKEITCYDEGPRHPLFNGPQYGFRCCKDAR